MSDEKIVDMNEIRAEMLSAYPTKVARKRQKQIIVNDVCEDNKVPEIQANSRTAPGIITQRGCTYAGCKGVVVGPTRDILQITHGPIGCGFYSWLTRRNQSKVESPDQDNYMPYSMSTDMQDEDIVFGGEKKLKKAVRDAYKIFKPKAISIFSTCPVGLIGDDVHAVAREMQEELGITVFGMSCEGYKGVSQSAGHHIANNAVFTHVVGKNLKEVEGEFKINMLGEYNIGGDGFEIERILDAVGITLVTTFSGNSTYVSMSSAPQADLNVVQCHRSINYMAEMMETKWGIPWFKVNFIGAKATAKSLRKIAEYYKDAGLTERVEAFIQKEAAEVQRELDMIRPRLEGKTVMLYVGGSRAHHYQELFRELGMKILSAGYEFAHRDDYEGRNVLPDIKIDADSRNIEELKIEKDPIDYRDIARPENMEFSDYEGMMPEMDNGSLVIDDISHHETEVLIARCKPDLLCAGIKEKYVVQKHGVPLKQLHNYDMGGPYTGFRGAINFYREIDRLVNGSVWKQLAAPWNVSPELSARYVS
ncbi:MAG: nitrogenase molybdenum-iron protein alpha chain [Spirochaetaceae bacterium]|nr:MAG: nitrogenase molybdenum-iron protein alpha chain [Spirochaetaceae bacterium]